MSLIKDIGLSYREAWSIRKDIKEDIRNGKNHLDRMALRGLLLAWWLIALVVHVVAIAVPFGIVFVIAGHMGAFG